MDWNDDADLIELELPVHWACYLMYGDASGLDEGEAKRIDRFLARREAGHCLDVGEPEFKPHGGDYPGGLGGDYAVYTFNRL
jgi:hypothetical protein